MQASGILKSEKVRDGYGQKKANAIFKGSLIAMTVLLWEGSGICRNPYPVWAADESSQYGQYGIFDMGNSEAAGKIGTDIGDASPSLGRKVFQP